MLFLTRIPVRYNDGSRIPTSELEAVKTRAWQDFGGFTLSGPTEGAWVDDRTGIRVCFTLSMCVAKHVRVCALRA